MQQIIWITCRYLEDSQGQLMLSLHLLAYGVHVQIVFYLALYTSRVVFHLSAASGLVVRFNN